MRELVVTEFVSLDGVMEAPGGEPGYAHTGWVGDRFSEELFEHKLAEHLAADVLLLGRVTYESFAGAWPFEDGPMAEKINAMRKVVVSRTMTDPGWVNATVLAGDLEAGVRALKAEDGGPILVIGSRTLVQALLLAGLVDELRLAVFPVVLGSGRRLFPESPDLVDLSLRESVVLASGVVLQSYGVAAR